MPFVDVPLRDNLKLHYTLNPRFTNEMYRSQPFDATKHTIVFLHAPAQSSVSLLNQMKDARLASVYNLLFLDARFHGKTQGNERRAHTLVKSAECLVAALDQIMPHVQDGPADAREGLGVDAATLPSYTIFAEGIQGCPTAVWIALMRPRRLQGLLLASPGWMVERGDVYESLVHLEQVCLQDKRHSSRTLSDEFLNLCGDYFIGASPRVAERRAQLIEWLQLRYGAGQPAHDIHHIITSCRDRQPPSPDQLASITCPVVLLHGGEDRAVSPLAACEEWQRALKGTRTCSIVEIAGAPHLMSLSDYSIVNRVIAQFTARSLQSYKL